MTRRGRRTHWLVGFALLAFASVAGCAQVLDIPDRHTSAHLACEAGTCACEASFGDCDGNPKNGCESDFRTSQAACGACGNACDNGACVGGSCQCSGSFADCDGKPENGCETDLASSVDSCGACGHGCLGGGCDAGACMPVLFANEPDRFVTGGIVRVDDQLYFADTKYAGGLQSRIVRVPVAGGPVEVLSDLGAAEVDDFVGDASAMVVLSQTDVVAYDLASKQTQSLVTTTFDGNYDEVMIAGDQVYYSLGTDFDNSLHRVPLAGGPSALVTADLYVGPPQKILLPWGKVPYWVTGNGRIGTLDSGGAPVLWAPAGSGPIDAFHVNDQYFFLEKKGVIERHPLAGGQVDTVPALDATPGALSSLTSVGPTLFWMETSQIFTWDGIVKQRVAGAIMIFYRAKLVVTDDSVFFPQNDGIWRVAR